MDKTMKDRLVGLFFLAFGIFLWLMIPIYVPYEDELTKMGPRFFPKLASIGIMVLSVVIIISTFLKKREEESTGAKLVWREEFRVVILLAITIVYAQVMEYIGYLISTSIVVIIIMLFFKVKKWYYYPIALAFVGLVYFIFHNIMYVPLP